MKHELELRSSNVRLSSIVEYPPHAQLVILVLPSKLYVNHSRTDSTYSHH